MNFKYKTSFAHRIVLNDIKSSENIQISQASKDALSKLSVPWILDNSNKDLLGLCFNATIVNIFNRNNDGVGSKIAVSIARSFLHKPINIEHEKSDIVGHIFDYNITDKDFGKSLSYSDVEDKNVPFYITLNGFIYKIVSPEIAKLLIDIKKGEKSDLQVYASWEVVFDEYDIVVGRHVNARHIDDFDIISDPTQKEIYKKYLLSEDGNGKDENGMPVCRLITDPNAMAVGIGLTMYPAADVPPVYCYDYEDYYGSASNELCKSSLDKKEENNEKNNKSISHNENLDVLDIVDETNMKLTLDQIKQMIKETVKVEGTQSEALASITEKVAQVILDKSEEFRIDKEKAEQEAIAKADAIKLKEEKIVALEKELGETKASLLVTQEKISKIEKDQQEALAKQTFDSRMTLLDEEFELTDEDRKIISAQVSKASTDEEFTAIHNNFKVLLNSKLKENIKKQNEAKASQIKDAVESKLKELGVKNPLEEKKPDAGQDVPNNSSTASEKVKTLVDSLVEKLDKKNIKVTA